MADLALDFEIKSSIDKVWHALTDSGMLSEWVMENDFKPVVGHECQFRNKQIDLIVDCKVLEVEEPHKLSYTWVGGPIDTVVTWTLREVDGITHLHLDQTGFRAEGKAFNGAKYGWSHMVGELKKLIS